ncbi:MAG: hypothetical protein HC810_07975, partial [Acaryochloridaceae cyanobacterium RL_2_7]|nr:hypothetical protein [Acaryochloridaceae cyanobacterium RL_2_7]
MSRTWVKRLIFVAIALIAAALCVLFQPVNAELSVKAEGETVFSKQTLQNQLFRLFDLGVTDINGDSQLDIYTSNHSNEQFVLLNEGEGKFSDNQITNLNLNQDKEFPGLEYSLKHPPKPSKPGIYIYWTDRRLNIEAHNLKEPEKFKGNITVAAKLKIEKQVGIDSELVLSPSSDADIISSSLNFKATQANGKLTALPGNVALPFIFQWDDTVPLDQVYVGHDYVSPEKYRFDLFMRDRHGMAWHDINNDGKLDVYINRGALKGRIDKLPGSFADELLVQDASGDRFTDTIDPDSFKKGDCPALQTAWVDVNRDQQLDIFNLCYKPTTPVQTYPPQLFIHSGNGVYTEKSTEFNLAEDADGSFLWMDVDDDGDADLFRSTSEAFVLFRNQGKTFASESIGNNPGGVAKTFDGSNNLTAADYDN